MVAFSFVGWSNSGKTTLITNLVSTLTAKHKRVAALKKIGHGFDMQPSGKDSSLFYAAGARPVYIISDHELVTVEPALDHDAIWQRVNAANIDCDFILLEGFRPHGVPLIEVFNSRINNRLKFPANQLTAVVGDQDPAYHIPFFLASDQAGIIRFMEAYHG